MKVLLLLLAALPAFSTAWSSIVADKTTASGTRVTWTTDIATYSCVIWGTVSGSLTNGVCGVSTVTTAHQWFVASAPPNTLIYYKVCETLVSCDATERSFTTSAAPTPYPALPVAPAAVTLPAIPTLTGTSLTVDSTCSNLVAHIATLKALDGNLNHEIHIPAGTVCAPNSGSTTGDANQPGLTIPVKTGSNPTGTGVITIIPDATLPPEGARITSAWTTSYFVNTNIGISETATAPPNCVLGQMYWDFIVALTANWALKECTVAGTSTYALVAKTTFTGTPPSSCTSNSWYQKTDASDVALGIYRCDNLGRILNVQLGPVEGIRFAATKGWRFVGITFDALRWPTSSIPAWITDNTVPAGSRFTAAIDFKTATNVAIDRCRFTGGTYPNRFQQLLLSAGTNIYVANNSIEGVSQALTPAGGAEPSNQAEFTLFNASGGQYLLFDNNYVEGAGIGVIGTDDSTTYVSDARITRNWFYVPDTYYYGSATSDGHFYHIRHQVEMKRGVRWLIQGNTMQGGFSTVNNAFAVAISPRPGTSGATVLISDIDVRDNTITNHTNGLYAGGHNDNDASQAQVAQRIRFLNNNLYGINGDRYATGYGQRRGDCFETALGGEDVIIEGNTCNQVANTGQYPAILLTDLTYSGWGSLRYVGNIATHGPVVNNTAGISQANNVNRGTTDLALAFQQYTATPNVFINLNSENSANYPAGNLWPASVAAVGFYDSAASDFRLRYSSTYAPTGAGQNADAIRAATGVVYNLRALTIASTSATLAYTAPDSTTACTVEYGTSSTAGTGSRVTDTTGSRFRTKGLTGLSTGTLYYYRVYCGQMASGSFTTS